MTLPHHLATIVLAIRTALSAYTSRSRAHSDLLLLVWTRVGRTAARLERLFTLWQQGTLKPPRPRPASSIPAKATPDPATPEPTQGARTLGLRLPRAKGWLIRLIPEAAPAGGQLESFIHRPDVAEFVAQVPRAGRHLRPLCRMQGLALPDYLTLPTCRRKQRPPRARKPRPWPLKDFPPYLRRAIRAWRNPSPAPEPARVITPAAPPASPSPLGPQGFDIPSGFTAPRGFDTPWTRRKRG